MFDAAALAMWLYSALNELKKKNVTEATLLYDTVATEKIEHYDFGRTAALITNDVMYQFTQFKSSSEDCKNSLKTLVLVAQDKNAILPLESGLLDGEVIGRAISVTKDLANLPPNICNAAYLAKEGQALARRFPKIKTTVLGENELSKLGMNAYLAVGQGSQNESKLTIMEYTGAQHKSEKPIVLIGKGLTFDSGGISIKPSAAMDEMKYDMCGAATVLGVMQAVAELKLPLNVIGLMAGCENMPSGSACRPGDILTTMSGQTVEVINTDAEGRLVLCDVLSYASRFKPAHVIDIATLTGACVIALGHHYSALLANDDVLADDLLCAAKKSRDKTWRLPLDDEFQKQIDSPFADMVNTGGREGGTITAACFLSRFTKEYSWAHLDIAGTAWLSSTNKGATGRPVSLLVQFFLDKAKV